MENKRKGRFNSPDKIELRSAPVQEILSRPPKWIIRYGISIIFVVIATIFVGSYFIKYPEIIKGKIEFINKHQAKITVPISNSGKIENGQTINIKLDNYPYMEYGMIKVKIDKLKLIKNKNVYYFLLDMPEKLTTTYKTSLPYIPQMQGSAEIITKDQRLINKFIKKL
ncbi:MAG: hypothetical protein IJR03_08385 [Bacteroidales bacterium]|nr:hypothetical protein [Bacteroidales bacterium]